MILLLLLELLNLAVAATTTSADCLLLAGSLDLTPNNQVHDLADLYERPGVEIGLNTLLVKFGESIAPDFKGQLTPGLVAQAIRNVFGRDRSAGLSPAKEVELRKEITRLFIEKSEGRPAELPKRRERPSQPPESLQILSDLDTLLDRYRTGEPRAAEDLEVLLRKVAREAGISVDKLYAQHMADAVANFLGDYYSAAPGEVAARPSDRFSMSNLARYLREVAKAPSVREYRAMVAEYEKGAAPARQAVDKIREDLQGEVDKALTKAGEPPSGTDLTSDIVAHSLKEGVHEAGMRDHSRYNLREGKHELERLTQLAVSRVREVRRLREEARLAELAQKAKNLARGLATGELSLEGVKKEHGADMANAALENVTVQEALKLFETLTGPDRVRGHHALRILETMADKVGMERPHTLTRLKKALGDYVETQNKTYPGSQPELKSAAKLHLKHHPDNILGYERPASRPPTGRKPQKYLSLVNQMVILDKGFLPTLKDLLPDVRTLQLGHKGQSEKEEIASYWLTDSHPNSFTVPHGDREIPVLVHYDRKNGLPRAFYPYAKEPGPRPEGYPPETKAFDIEGKVVWAIPTEVTFRHDGGNLVKTKDFILTTERVFSDNKTFDRGRPISAEEVKRQWAQAADPLNTGKKPKVEIIGWAPGETTGHADMMVTVLNSEKNIVAVPKIENWTVPPGLEKSDPIRYQGMLHTQRHLEALAAQLTTAGLTVERIPMFAPTIAKKPLSNALDASALSPFGYNLNFVSPANVTWAPDNTMLVPFHTEATRGVPYEMVKKYHQEMARTLAKHGIHYQPIESSGMAEKSGGPHCVVVQVPLP